MKIEEPQALDAFGALSQETRLRMVRALVEAGPEGMSAGAVGDAVEASSSGASFHLAHLERAGLVRSRRAIALDHLQRQLRGAIGPRRVSHA